MLILPKVSSKILQVALQFFFLWSAMLEAKHKAKEKLKIQNTHTDTHRQRHTDMHWDKQRRLRERKLELVWFGFQGEKGRKEAEGIFWCLL